ncbi:hypothetical protein LTR85_000943 [Meristemomyces frigidus]|nr:hypothetical protein LTR85_000943 [Meristemomyces frigidus]
MILSPYRNPPYRTPTPKTSKSPPPEPSPKRKRAESQKSVASLQIDTTETHDFAPETGANSPRTKVAERLHDLSLQHAQSPHLSPSAEPTGAPRKRLKRSQPLRRATPGHEIGSDAFSTPESSSQPAVFSRHTSPIESDETPDCRRRVESTPPRSPAPPQYLRQSSDVPAVGIHEDERRERLPSPSPPTPLDSPSQGRDEVVNPTSSPLHATEDSSFDQITLTWQDHEITGYNIDLTSPDDDGLGINGIGFKPTSTIANARSQKRRQQVNEWRVREAKESRQKRFERRRGAGGAGSSGGSSRKRIVRFEGVG